MCATCGCSDNSRPRLTDLETGLAVPLDEPAEPPRAEHLRHEHGQDRPRVGTTISIETAVLAKNDRLADLNRGWLARRAILALNLVSSPGSGKTTLLERTIRDLAGALPMSVIEGDQETLHDAERIRAAGCRVVQINTGAGCHLDAAMLGRALEQLNPAARSVVLVENVGNLVCPALFDLGERAKVVIVSTAEGDDKPLKYPHMFRAGTIVILNKIDLLPYVPFDEAKFDRHVRAVNPSLRVVRVSATRGDGLSEWYDWLRAAAADVDATVARADL